MYVDPRAGTEDMPETIITCKHFLDACEDEKYGWRWECPVGGRKCQYRHQLPEGYVMLTKKERAEEKKKQLEQVETRTLEEVIEEERSALKYDDLTPVTKESFFAWKKRRAEKKQKELEDRMKAEEEKAAKGKKGGGGQGKNSILNGRALFLYNKELFKDDDNAADIDFGEEESKAEVAPAKKEAIVDKNLFAAEADAALDEDVDFD